MQSCLIQAFSAKFLFLKNQPKTFDVSKCNIAVMKKIVFAHPKLLLVLLYTVGFFYCPKAQQEKPKAAKNIVEGAVAGKYHYTLAKAIDAAGLKSTLQGVGPYTVFAPNDMAFNKLPKGMVDALLKPENKASLYNLLVYHMVEGRVTSKQLLQLIKENNGTYILKTIQGSPLLFKSKGDKISIEDEKGSSGILISREVDQENGIVHTINTVLLPKN